jgi:heptosyltransferase I
MKRKAIFRFFDRYIGIPVLAILSIFLKKKKRLPIENINKILIIKLAAIGDTILIIPMLRALRKHLPDSEITFMCSPINISVVEKISYINKIINCDVHSFYNLFKFFKFIREIRKEEYDILIDAGQWERINSIIAALSRNQYSIGFKTKHQFKHLMFDSFVYHLKTKHELETFLDLLVPLGIIISDEDKKLKYFLSKDNLIFAEKFWKENNFKGKPVICLHPGCGENGKPREWSNENYIELGKRLIAYDKSIKLLLSGPYMDVERCSIIERALKDSDIGDCITNVAGLYSLDDVVALVGKCDLIVCSNTGMLHIAGCVGTKTMGLHGPTNPVKWGSYAKNAVLIQSDKFCSPCLYLGHDYGCTRPDCMKYISVDDVFIYIRKALTPDLFQIKINM